MKPLRLALLGESIGYSRSPEIFTAAFQILDMEGHFDVLSVTGDQLEECVGRLRNDGHAGFSVTIPHKQAIMPFLSSLDPDAQAVGAVNSVAVRSDQMIGYNTDSYGFSFALRRHGFTGCKRAMILGCGGAARAVAHALNRDFDMTRFVIVGRNPDRLKALVRHSIQTGHIAEIEATVEWSQLGASSTGCELVVNCTPAGGPNHEQEVIFPAGFDWSAVDLYSDLNYNADSRMLSEARRNKTETLDGSAMLVAQALRSLELWTGHVVNFDSIYHKVFPKR